MSLLADHDRAFARSLITQILSREPFGTPIKSALDHVSALTGISFRKARSIWNDEPCRIDAAEIAALRSAALPSQADRLMAAATALEAIDAQLHREQIYKLRDLADQLRHMDQHRPMACP